MNIKSFNQFNNSILILFILLLFSYACKKEKNNNPLVLETGTLTDIDGNIYKTVKIGDQWWMTENLKVSRYRNGDSIKFITESNYKFDSATWNNTNAGAYCIIDNSSPTSLNYQGKKFGFLYNYYAVSDPRNIAPEGWHIPTDEEWKQLEKNIGLSDTEVNEVNWRGTNQANKLRNNNDWNKSTDIYNIWGTNETGFSAQAGSCCMFFGVWGKPGCGYTGFWWTSTKYGNLSWYRHLDYNQGGIFRYYGPKTYGFSIRCVKD